MMSSDDNPIPVSECTPRSTIAVSPAAMALAAKFQTALPAAFIVAFSWHDGEKVRAASKDAPWVDKGPGVGLGAYRTSEVPKEAVCQSGSMSYAVLIRQAILDDYPKKIIDTDEAGRIVLK